MPSILTSIQLLTILIAAIAIALSTLPASSPFVKHISSLLPPTAASPFSSFSSPYGQCVTPIPGQLIAAPFSLLPPPSTRVLVTGAAGFIGSHVAAYLQSELKLTVVAVDDLSGGFLSNVPPSVIFVQGDVQDDAFVRRLFARHGPFAVVYHLAAYAAEGLSHFIRQFNYRNNLVASVSLLNAAVRGGVSTFVFTSSIAVYGSIPPPMRESDTPHPHDPYGIAKFAFELDLQAAAALFGLNFVIVRPHNVYGPHQNVLDRYRNVIAIFLSHIMRNLSLPVFGDGQQTRAFSFVSDVAAPIAAAAFIPAALNQTFNVGSERPTTLNTLAAVVSEAMGVPLRVHYLPQRQEVVDAVSSHDKLRCVMGIGREEVGLREGIQRVVDWVRQREQQTDAGGFVPVEFDEVEVIKNMPPSWLTERIIESDRRRRQQEAEALQHEGVK